MAQTVFERYEKKYLITRQQYEQLCFALQDKMTADRYGRYTISNLYYDTEDYQLIRHSIEGPVYKEKLRLRCYGTAEADTPVFLELKKKYAGIVYKRRAILPYAEALRFLDCGLYAGEPSQILNEIQYFLGLYPVRAKTFIAYERQALSGLDDDELRITFDSNIRFRTSALGLDKGNWGQELLSPQHMLMEIKIPDAFPLWLSKLLSELGIYSSSFSKYGSIYSGYLAKSNIREGEAANA